MFNLAIDSKLRGCDVVSLKVEDVAPHGMTVDRATSGKGKPDIPSSQHIDVIVVSCGILTASTSASGVPDLLLGRSPDLEVRKPPWFYGRVGTI